MLNIAPVCGYGTQTGQVFVPNNFSQLDFLLRYSSRVRCWRRNEAELVMSGLLFY